RREFRGGLGGCERDRRTCRGSADGRRRRRRALCVYQPGTAGPAGREKLAKTEGSGASRILNKKTNGRQSMTSVQFNYAPLLPAGLPAPAARWTGLAKYSFVGGNNDPDGVPVEGLVDAVTAVLRREGKSLATYNLAHGPQGYVPLREFLVKKLKRDAGI